MRASPANLPDDCRVRCERCRGRGSYADIEALIACAECHRLNTPCKLHACRMCGGSGLVCPACRGVRLVRSREWDTNAPRGEVEIEPCHRCWDTTNKRVDIQRERHTIDRYLVRWRYNQGVSAETIETTAAETTESLQRPPAGVAPMDPLDRALQQQAQAAQHHRRPAPLPPYVDDSQSGTTHP